MSYRLDKLSRKSLFVLTLSIFSLIPFSGFPQNINLSLTNAVTNLENDSQFKNGFLGFYVADAQTGEKIFDKNGTKGMATASSLKVLTASTAFELLGKDFAYKTEIGGDVEGENFILKISDSGDPTLGSWRFENNKIDAVLNKIVAFIKKKNVPVKDITIQFYNNKFSYQPVPDAWLWQDMGNYFGAAAFPFNFHENQYDLHLKSGEKVGDTTVVTRTTPFDMTKSITNNILAAAKGSGDNGYIFSSPYNPHIYTTGTIPVSEKDFVISGSVPDPAQAFSGLLLKKLQTDINPSIKISEVQQGLQGKFVVEDSIVSPSLDKIVYWFLQKSINLYGEALLKTIAYRQEKIFDTDKGAAAEKLFWESRGIDGDELRMVDGSGLSPVNRVSPKALVQILLHAKKATWYKSFEDALPTINGLKMKSGNIGGVMSYTGYVTSKQGKSYVFCIIVNNFGGSPTAVKNKLWKVLDLMK